MILHDQKSKILSNRRGVALLFALGILSLLLVLGLAFVTNAVVAQKAAFNNSSRSQAKLLAQSAISQIQTAVMEYQLEIENIRGTTGSTNDNILITDLATIVSFNTSANADDQLSSKLPPPKPIRYNNQTEEDHYRDLETGAGASVDSLRAPKWVYVDNGQTGNNRRLIGRFAYRVLPPNSSTRMNLGYVLQGVSTTLPHPTVLKEVNQIPLAIDNTTPNLGTPLAFWDTVAGSPAVLPTQVERMVGSYNQFFSAWADYFPYTNTNREEQKWLKRWFDDGVIQPDLEVYRQESTGTPAVEYYHRFNLNMSAANWNDFKNQGSNSDAAVNALLNAPAIPFRNDPANSYTTAATTLPTALQGGLPFLRLIGDARKTFASINDRRKQIAANLLDYCDSDSIPTSDVSATGTIWSSLVTSGGSMPTYTGNEQTAYINEIGLGIKVDLNLQQATFPGAFNKAVNPELTLTPEVIAELIKIYQTIPDEYRFYTALESLSVRVNVYADDIYVSYTDATDNPLETNKKLSPISITNEQLTWTQSATPAISFPHPSNSTIGNFNSNGYAVNAVSLPSFNRLFDLATAIQQAENAPAGAKYTDVKLGKVRFEISEVSFRFGPFALNLVQGGTDQNGVDFVRWNIGNQTANNTIKLFSNLKDSGGTAITDTNGWISTDQINLIQNNGNRYFYVGGLEAIDPRQNLNVSLTATESDWYISPRIGNHENNDDATQPVLSMNIVSSNAAEERFSAAGAVNTWSDPSSPLTAVPGRPGSTQPQSLTQGDFDVEQVNDPAYRTNNQLSTAYIRNAPMESPWELGAIHRGAAWQTINLKNAASPQNINDPINLTDFSGTAGTSYQMGDGGILDQVKFTNNIWSYGKIDINMFNSSYLGHDNTRDSMLLRAMLNNFMEVGEEYNQAGSSGRALTSAEVTNITNGVENLPAPYPLTSRAQILFTQPNSPASLPNNPLGLNRGFWNYWATAGSTPPAHNDREQEELISKMISIFKTEPAQVTTFQADIIAQSILDVDGTIAKVDRTGAVRTQAATHGTFDYDATNNVYFDEITGEVKMRVTFDRNPRTGKIKVRNITYTK